MEKSGAHPVSGLVTPIRRRRLWAAWLSAMAVLAACMVVGWMVLRLGVGSASGKWNEVLLVVVGITSIVGGGIVAMTFLGRAYTTIDEIGIRQLTVLGWQSIKWGDIIAVDMERRPGEEIVAVKAQGRVIQIDTQYFERERLMTCLSAREMK